MTYPNSDGHKATASTANAGEVGAPGKDIEVTPAMIKAGARELVSFDLDYESWEDAAIRVYKAMYALR